MGEDNRRRRASAALAILTGLTVIAAAPVPAQAQPASGATGASAFLTRVDVELGWSALVTDDRRFDWQGTITFDADVVDTGTWRARLAARYDAVLGRVRRRYDLNHGTYAFEAAAAWRTGATEITGRLTHVSRHLVDRDQGPAISWNTFGARVSHRLTAGPSIVDAEIGIDRAMQAAFVDYAWMSDARVGWRRPIRDRTELFADAWGGVVGVRRDIAGRPRICGGRFEGGVRFEGRAGTLEVFAGYERRMDAYPADRFRVRMFVAGFRITS